MYLRQQLIVKHFTLHTNNCEKEVNLGEVKTIAVNSVIFDDDTKHGFS